MITNSALNDLLLSRCRTFCRHLHFAVIPFRVVTIDPPWWWLHCSQNGGRHTLYANMKCSIATEKGETAVFAPSAFWSDFCTFIATTFNNEESRLNTPSVWDCENLLQPCSRLYLQHSLRLCFFSMCLLDLYLHLPRLSLDWRPR